MSATPKVAAFDAQLAVDALCDPRHPIKMEAAKWATEELSAGVTNADHARRDQQNEFWSAGWSACAKKGFLGLSVPEAYGGSGTDIITTLLQLEGLGYGCRDNGLTFGVVSQMWSIQTAIAGFASAELAGEWLPRLVSGEAIGAFAITEPETGSDTFSLQTTAVKNEYGYVLDGQKAHLTFGSIADVVMVFAATNPEAGRWGISGFLVPTNAPGVVLGENVQKLGTRTTPYGHISFAGVQVSESDRVGAEGAGASIFSASMNAERAYVFAAQLGAMERQLDDAVRYATERRQFGKPIGDFQAVSHRIADMKVRFETARALLYKSAITHASGRPPTMSAAIAKVVSSEAAVASGLDAIMVHGANGYTSEFGVERDFRDAVGGLIYSGTTDIQRNIIARLLGLG